MLTSLWLRRRVLQSKQVLATFFGLWMLFIEAQEQALAHEYYTNNFKLIHPWVQAMEAGSNDAAVYCVFDSVQAQDRLLKAYASIASSVEFRRKEVGADVAVDAIDISKTDTFALSSTTSYLLLKDLRAPLQWGRSYFMTLVFEKAGLLNVTVSIGGP